MAAAATRVTVRRALDRTRERALIAQTPGHWRSLDYGSSERNRTPAVGHNARASSPEAA